MKVLLSVSIALLALMSAGAIFRQTSTHKRVPVEVIKAYTSWLQKHGKLYSTPSERAYRLAVFHEQSVYVERINREYERASESVGRAPTVGMFAMNGFGDLTSEEFAAKYTGGGSFQNPQTQEEQNPQQPDSAPVQVGAGLGLGFDVVIRQQGSCGACWAFAAVAALEKFYFDRLGARLEFSQQELVDCKEGIRGCQGGIPEFGFKYASQYGLSVSSVYPYVAAQGACKRSLPERVKIPNIQIQSEAYAQQRVIYFASKGIHSTVLLYGSGKFRYLSKNDEVFDAKLGGECGVRFDHALNVASASGNRVTVYNSWGREWGTTGFKTISVCAENNLYGTGSRVAHPYGST